MTMYVKARQHNDKKNELLKTIKLWILKFENRSLIFSICLTQGSVMQMTSKIFIKIYENNLKKYIKSFY